MAKRREVCCVDVMQDDFEVGVENLDDVREGKGSSVWRWVGGGEQSGEGEREGSEININKPRVPKGAGSKIL